jgi:hypothetical protein
MMKSILDDLWPKLLQKFDSDDIVHTEFVPPGQTVNGKFYCDVLRWLRENIRRIRPDKWRNNSWAWNHDNAVAHASLVVQQFLASTNMSHPPPSLLTGPCPLWFFPIPKNEIENKGVRFWQHWRSPDRIAERDEDTDSNWLPEVLLIMEVPLESLSMPKGTTSKGVGANRNFGRCLSYSRRISRTFG